MEMKYIPTKRNYILIDGKTYVSIPSVYGETIQKPNVKPKPPEADFRLQAPVEIVVYTKEGSQLTARRMLVPKETVDKITNIPKLDDRIQELEQIIEMSNYSYQNDDAICTDTPVDPRYFEEMGECYKQMEALKAEFKEMQTKYEKSMSNVDQYKIKEDYDILDFIEFLEAKKRTFSIENGQKLDPDIKNAIDEIRNNLYNIYEQEIEIQEQEIKKVIIKIIALVTALAAALTITILTMNLSRLQQFIAYMITAGIISVSSKIAKEGPDGKIATAKALKKYSEKKVQELKLHLQNQLEKRQTQEAPIKSYETRVVTPNSFKAELREMTIQEQLQALQAMKDDLTSTQDSEQTAVQGYALVRKREKNHI